MAGRSHRGLRRSVAVVAGIVCAAALLTGSSTAATMGKPLRVLQMNLCNSGIARCYTGRSVPEAARVIRAEAPDVVTVNEVCEDDVYALDRSLVDVHRGRAVPWVFKAAVDRRTAGPFRCRNGQPYGIGLLVHIPAPDGGYSTYSGIYPVQDTRDPEERVWLCLYAIGDFYACTTQLASTSPTVALAQCIHLMGTAIPLVRKRSGYRPTVLGGDLNLSNGGQPDVRSCVRSDYLREDDGGVQHIVATTDFRVASSRSIGMDGTTDHPGLAVALTVAGS